eukprot:310579_1
MVTVICIFILLVEVNVGCVPTGKLCDKTNLYSCCGQGFGHCGAFYPTLQSSPVSYHCRCIGEGYSCAPGRGEGAGCCSDTLFCHEGWIWDTCESEQEYNNASLTFIWWDISIGIAAGIMFMIIFCTIKRKLRAKTHEKRYQYESEVDIELIEAND